jgi:hypothetical protein
MREFRARLLREPGLALFGAAALVFLFVVGILTGVN